MSETTQEERDEWRIGIDPILHPAACKRITLRPDQVVRLINDADRLAAIERDLSKLANTMDDMLPSTPEVGSANKYWAGKIRAILDPPGQSRDMGDSDDPDVGRYR